MIMLGSWFLKAKMMRAYASGDLFGAIEYAKKCLNKNDKDTGALWTMAECYRLQGNDETAIAYGKKSYAVDAKHLDTLQLLSEVYFDREDYKHAYEYACRAISAAEEINTALQPYIDNVKQSLSSSRIMSVPTRSIRGAIDEEQKTTQEWIAWALRFKAWYESNQLPNQSEEMH